MKSFVIGLMAGVVLASVIFIPVLRWQRQLSWRLGVTAGTIQGKRFAADALGKEFGQTDGTALSKNIFSVKHTDVVSIETNGIKTVRVIP
jgi:hypothetical protein